VTGYFVTQSARSHVNTLDIPETGHRRYCFPWDLFLFDLFSSPRSRFFLHPCTPVLVL